MGAWEAHGFVVRDPTCAANALLTAFWNSAYNMCVFVAHKFAPTATERYIQCSYNSRCSYTDFPNPTCERCMERTFLYSGRTASGSVGRGGECGYTYAHTYLHLTDGKEKGGGGLFCACCSNGNGIVDCF